jgi:hypothetical protein
MYDLYYFVHVASSFFGLVVWYGYCFFSLSWQYVHGVRSVYRNNFRNLGVHLSRARTPVFQYVHRNYTVNEILYYDTQSDCAVGVASLQLGEKMPQAACTEPVALDALENIWLKYSLHV